jgi:hypothetical protein
MTKSRCAFVSSFRAVPRMIANASKRAAAPMLYVFVFVVWCLSPGVVLLVWLVISGSRQGDPPIFDQHS